MGESSDINFNHEDIEKVDFEGYISDEFNKINENLKRILANNKDIETSKSQYQFDENGVVIFDGSAIETPKNDIIQDQIIDNPFKVNYVQSDSKPENDISEIKGTYQFDANGVIITDENFVDANEKIKTNVEYQFDANGVIVEDSSQTNKNNNTSTYKFDQNGIIIGE